MYLFQMERGFQANADQEEQCQFQDWMLAEKLLSKRALPLIYVGVNVKGRGAQPVQWSLVIFHRSLGISSRHLSACYAGIALAITISTYTPSFFSVAALYSLLQADRILTIPLLMQK